MHLSLKRLESKFRFKYIHLLRTRRRSSCQSDEEGNP